MRLTEEGDRDVGHLERDPITDEGFPASPAVGARPVGHGEGIGRPRATP
jgi:hypothetical protein